MLRRLALFAAALVATCALSLLGADAGETGPRRALLVNASKPTWSFNFAARGAIPAGSTFTRASSRSCWNAAGVLATLSSNVTCFHYDPATGQPWGYLAEMQSTNAVLYSQDFSQSSWTRRGTFTVGATTTAPDGTNTAQLISGLDAAGVGDVYETAYSNNGRFAANGLWQPSIFIKKVTSSGTLKIQDPAGSARGQWTINLSLIGSGWERLTPSHAAVTVNTAFNADANGHGGINIFASAGAPLSMYLWGAQGDTAGVGVTSYIPTAGSTVTRAQDILTMPLTALPGWRATQGGVLAAAYRLHTVVPSTPGYNQMAVWFYKTDYTNSIRLMANSSGGGNAYFDTYSGGVAQGAVTPAAAAAYVRHKMAGGWSIPRNVVAQDGGTPVGVNTATAFPGAPDTAGFGLYSSHGLNGTLESVAYYAGARSDSFVQQVSR